MDCKKILPIGSIVLLKDGEKKLMISGIMQSDGGVGKQYDYLGLLYPEGHLGGQFQFLFNHEEIAQIVFRGYEDDERKLFLEKLSSFYEDSAK